MTTVLGRIDHRRLYEHIVVFDSHGIFVLHRVGRSSRYSCSMLCATRLLAAAVAIALAAVATAGCNALPSDDDCPSPLTAVPVRNEPSDLYAGSAVGCTGDTNSFCDSARYTGWVTRLREDCGRTLVELCSDNFAVASCINVYLDDSDRAVVEAKVTSDTGNVRGYGVEDGWVEIASWTEVQIRGRVALDLGNGWVAGTFQGVSDDALDGHPD